MEIHKHIPLSAILSTYNISDASNMSLARINELAEEIMLDPSGYESVGEDEYDDECEYDERNRANFGELKQIATVLRATLISVLSNVKETVLTDHEKLKRHHSNLQDECKTLRGTVSGLQNDVYQAEKEVERLRCPSKALGDFRDSCDKVYGVEGKKAPVRNACTRPLTDREWRLVHVRRRNNGDTYSMASPLARQRLSKELEKITPIVNHTYITYSEDEFTIDCQ